MLKVLILSHSSELSGAERSMVDLFAHWSKQGLVEPHFIIRRPVNNLAPELRRQGWVYTPLHYTNWSQRNPSSRAEDIFRNALFNTQAIFDIEKIIQEVKPDLVMTNTIVSPWAAIAAYFQGVPHIWFVREYGDIDHRHIFELGREKMLEDIDALSAMVVTNSQTLGNHISDRIDKNKIVPQYTPFDIDALVAKSKQSGQNPFKNPAALKLVITGKIAPGKGQVEAAEAVAELIKAGHDTELCVIGKIVEPNDDKELLAVIEKHNLNDKVHLIGHIANPLTVLKYADVGLMASKQEAFGRVTFEYMVLGLPVVGTDSGATPEMITEGQNGYLYKSGDVAELVNRLGKYTNDRELIKTHGTAAQAKAEAMMRGPYNATALYKRLVELVNDKSWQPHRTLHFSHRWLEYPGVAKQYITDSQVISLKKLLYQRLRHRAKLTYLWFARFLPLPRKRYWKKY